MKTKKVVAYTDPQHGWAKVKRSELKALNIEEKISVYSYQRGDFVYLEEDGDLGTYIAAQREAGVEVQFNSKHSNKSSKIRSYDCFRVM